MCYALCHEKGIGIMTISGKTYHDITSYDRYRMKGHALDWANQPAIHKVYPGMDYQYLPRPENLPQVSVRHAASPVDTQTRDRAVTVDRLSVILALAYGITGRVQAGKKEYFYRGAPSAGALYPVEVYLAVGGMNGLAAGLYHYDVSGLGLCRLRSGNIMPFADRCIGLEPDTAPPDLAFFLTGITFRSAWKYMARAFRYLLLDTGHVLENLLMSLKAEGLTATVHYNVDREASNLLMGCDPSRETCFSCVRIAGGGTSPAGAPGQLSPLPDHVLDAGKVCEKEEVFEEIEQISLASSKPPTAGKSTAPMLETLGLSPGSWQPMGKAISPSLTDFPTTIVRRRSRRNFVKTELPEGAFWGILDVLSHRSKQDRPENPPGGSCVSTGILVQNTQGITPGFYVCDFRKERIGLIRTGDFHTAMAGVCLDQRWLQNTALHFCFMADLAYLDSTWGARGYRYAMLEAGRLGEAVYLAATAFGLGACGIGALYDGEAKTLLGLEDTGALLYLVAAGPVKSDGGFSAL